jgi:hypoxanthine phosphoribosyltransferase
MTENATITVTMLFDEAEITRRVGELAGELARVLEGDFTVVAILKGSFVFAADLIRALDREGLRPGVEFMRLSSYGGAKQSSGKVRLIGDAPEDFGGRRVLLLDDIVDSGRSLAHAKEMIRERGASQVLTVALLDKPSRREVDIAADFVGFTIEDLFVVGYGIDYDQKYRHLPYIGTVD